jgi:hypothetical protein
MNMIAYILVDGRRAECIHCKETGGIAHTGWHEVILQMPGLVDVREIKILFHR